MEGQNLWAQIVSMVNRHALEQSMYFFFFFFFFFVVVVVVISS